MMYKTIDENITNENIVLLSFIEKLPMSKKMALIGNLKRVDWLNNK